MNQIVSTGLRTGAALVATTATTMMVCSTVERGSPWAGLNAMATAVGAGGRRVGDRFDRGITPTGIAVLTGGLLLWGVGYEALLAATGRRRSLLTGALSGLGGYVLDRFVLSRQLVPNFRRKLGLTGTIAKYTALGLASAISAGGQGASAPQNASSTLGTVGQRAGADEGTASTTEGTASTTA